MDRQMRHREPTGGRAPEQGPERAPNRRKIALPRTFLALQNRDFRLLWTGTLGSYMAMQMVMVSRGYLAYALTGSAAVLGIVSLARGLPQLVFTLFGGVLADRVKKRNLLLVTQIITGGLALITAVLVSTGAIEIWHLIVLGALEGSVFSLNMPARMSFIPELVPPQERMNAIALNSAGMNFTRIFGPALAGFLISVPLVGLERVFYFQTACYLLPVAMLFRIKPRYAASQKRNAPMLKEFTDGLRYIKRHETLTMLLTIGFIPLLLGFPYQTLLPVFASDKVLNVGASGLGMMSAVTGVGALAGSLVIASYSHARRRGLLQLGACAAWGVSLLFFALSQQFPVALIALVFVGVTGSVYQSLNSTLIMAESAPEYYGRVMSVNQLGFSMTMLAPLPIGIAADAFGAQATIAVCAALMTVFVLLTATFVGNYRRLELPVSAEPVRARTAGGVR